MYTKLFIVAFLACFASSFALSKGLGDKIECLHQTRVAQGRIFEGEIKAAIEKFRKALREGVNGSPPLDPLDVTDYHLSYNNEFINLDSNWTAKSQGLSSFQVSDLSLSLIGLNLKFTFKLPSVTASGDYSADLTSPLIAQRIFGKGSFNVGLKDFTIKGKGKIATKLVHGKVVVQIKKLEVDMTLNSFSLALTGFMNDEKLSQDISNKLTSDLPKMLQENKAKINEAIEKILPYINDYLAGNLNAFAVTPAIC